MRLKLDENLPVTAAKLLSARGFDVDTVRDEGLSGQPDDSVWLAARTSSNTLSR
jgi:predicted nuclease of predicted toxin-antitoxin system